MKAYRISVLVIDHDGLGAKGIKDNMEAVSYPNDCLYPKVIGSEEADLGEWTDDHPLNQIGCDPTPYFDIEPIIDSAEAKARATRELVDLRDKDRIGPWELVSKGAFGKLTFYRPTLDEQFKDLEEGCLVVSGREHGRYRVNTKGDGPDVEQRLVEWCIMDPTYNEGDEQCSERLAGGWEDTFEEAMRQADKALAALK